MGVSKRRVHRPDITIEQGATSSIRANPKDAGRDLFAADPRALLRKAPMAVLICDARGKITFANELAKKMAQINPQGRSLDSVPGILGEMFDEYGRHIAAPEWPCATALRGEITRGKEFHLVRWDRTSYSVLISASPICGTRTHINGAMTTLTDISEHKRREIALRGEAIYKERSRMAGEIHDNLSQGLNAVVLQLDAAEHHFKKSASEAQRRVNIALSSARQNLAEARRLMWILSHPNFDSEDPASAIAFISKQVFEGSSVKLELALDDEPAPLYPRLRRELVQIGKEAMVNALKHANATKVRVELCYDSQTVRLSVSDDGRGFVRAPISVNQGYGLLSMRTRAQNLGGKFLIDGKLGRGTRLTVTLPYSGLAAHLLA